MYAEQSNINSTAAQPSMQTPNKQLEIRALLSLIFLVNLGLVFGNTTATELVFHPESLLAGEWWRIFSWPFAHVSRYHLLIDSAAFLLLYQSLREANRRKRVLYTLAVIGGSLLLPLLISPEISELGLCGLSGPAHGLMAISALELLHGNEKKLGSLLLALLLLKTGWELFTGNAFMHDLHFGYIGQPIVSTHAGGTLAGLLCYYTYAQTEKTLFRRSCYQK